MAGRRLVVIVGKARPGPRVPLTTMVSRQSKRGCSRWCPLVMILWKTYVGSRGSATGSPLPPVSAEGTSPPDFQVPP